MLKAAPLIALAATLACTVSAQAQKPLKLLVCEAINQAGCCSIACAAPLSAARVSVMSTVGMLAR